MSNIKKGSVKFFKDDKGWGFVALKSGDAFLHIRTIEEYGFTAKDVKGMPHIEVETVMGLKGLEVSVVHKIRGKESPVLRAREAAKQAAAEEAKRVAAALAAAEAARLKQKQFGRIVEKNDENGRCVCIIEGTHPMRYEVCQDDGLGAMVAAGPLTLSEAEAEARIYRNASAAA
ncbi:MAG: cold shock domain-containing protein [Candidatus Kaiserbacteria bacterium]|nr:cold shock domain-containing protein [Candidatus Kaiserbacteria bacterium]MCB9816853.1 cold shock domain-containing protein [Candidatus Nomurabacteria bacterium]